MIVNSVVPEGSTTDGNNDSDDIGMCAWLKDKRSFLFPFPDGWILLFLYQYHSIPRRLAFGARRTRLPRPKEKKIKADREENEAKENKTS